MHLFLTFPVAIGVAINNEEAVPINETSVIGNEEVPDIPVAGTSRGKLRLRSFCSNFCANIINIFSATTDVHIRPGSATAAEQNSKTSYLDHSFE